MTVGELVYKQAVEQGYNPDFAKGLVSPLNKAMESYQKVFEDMKEPLKVVSRVVDSIRPQLEMLNNIKIPTLPQIPQISLPVSELLEDYYIRPEDRVHKVEIVNPTLVPAVSEEKETEFMIHSYYLPKGATWESVLIEFLDGHFVRVSHPNMKVRKFDFKDMGFLNGKSLKPDLKWRLFKAIADNGGALTSKDRDWDDSFTRNVKYELNQRLMKFFGMDTPPIPHYTKRRGYEAIFTIKSDR